VFALIHCAAILPSLAEGVKLAGNCFFDAGTSCTYHQHRGLLEPECACPRAQERPEAVAAWNFRARWADRSLLRPGTGALRWCRKRLIPQSPGCWLRRFLRGTNHRLGPLGQRRERLVLVTAGHALIPVIDGGVIDPAPALGHRRRPVGIARKQLFLAPIDVPLERLIEADRLMVVEALD